MGFVFLFMSLILSAEGLQLLNGIYGTFWIVYGVYMVWISWSKTWRALHRLNLPMLDRKPVIAELKCINLMEFSIGTLFICVLLVSPVLYRYETGASFFVFSWVLAGFLALFLAILPKPLLGLEAGGIFVRRESENNEAFLPFSMISFVDFTHSIIRIALKDSHAYFPYWYFVPLGDSKALLDGLRTLKPSVLAISARSYV
jgi:hypothetical protein